MLPGVRVVYQVGIESNVCVSGRRFDVVVEGQLQLWSRFPHQGDGE